MKTGGIVSTPRANLIVALGYILGGYIGSLVSFPPANISPFWPPSGIALAALLLCGKRILPGLFLGLDCPVSFLRDSQIGKDAGADQHE